MSKKTIKQKPAKKDKLAMRVKVYSPFATYFDSLAYSVTAENSTGQFDILPKHHNFMTLLKSSELLLRTERGEQKIRISGGIMHVRADQVTVFLDV